MKQASVVSIFEGNSMVESEIKQHEYVVTYLDDVEGFEEDDKVMYSFYMQWSLLAMKCGDSVLGKHETFIPLG